VPRVIPCSADDPVNVLKVDGDTKPVRLRFRDLCPSLAGCPAGGWGKTGKERQCHNLLLLLNVMGSSLEVASWGTV
jgi:hypothetical protein